MKNQTSPIGIVVVNTKSNFMDANFKHLPLMEIRGRRITASIYSKDLDKRVNVDFTLHEATSIFMDADDVEEANYLING